MKLQEQILGESSTMYVGNLSYYSTEEQVSSSSFVTLAPMSTFYCSISRIRAPHPKLSSQPYPSFLSALPSFLSALPSFLSALPSFLSALPSFLSALPSFLSGVPSLSLSFRLGAPSPSQPYPTSASQPTILLLFPSIS